VVNHDNVCVENGSSLDKNLDGGVPMKFDSFADMLSLKDITLIVNNL